LTDLIGKEYAHVRLRLVMKLRKEAGVTHKTCSSGMRTGGEFLRMHFKSFDWGKISRSDRFADS
jgi:hypothetical protein